MPPAAQPDPAGKPEDKPTVEQRPAEPPPVAEPVEEKPPLTPDERHERRQNRWLVLVTVLALAAAGAAVYGIVQAQDAKVENVQGNKAVNSLRGDLEVFREQTPQRLDDLENKVETTADAQTLSKVQDDVAALDKKVKDLEDQSGTGDLSNRLDDLENRVDDLEQEK